MTLETLPYKQSAPQKGAISLSIFFLCTFPVPDHVASQTDVTSRPTRAHAQVKKTFVLRRSTDPVRARGSQSTTVPRPNWRRRRRHKRRARFVLILLLCLAPIGGIAGAINAATNENIPQSCLDPPFNGAISKHGTCPFRPHFVDFSFLPFIHFFFFFFFCSLAHLFIHSFIHRLIH